MSLGTIPPTAAIPDRSAGPVSRASSSAHAAVNSIAATADDVAAKAKPAIERAAALAHHAVDTAAGAAAPAADWLSEQGERLDSTQKNLVADTCSYVAAHPLKVVGIAVVAGFLLGRIFR